jgi:hypothetical protein
LGIYVKFAETKENHYNASYLILICRAKGLFFLPSHVLVKHRGKVTECPVYQLFIRHEIPSTKLETNPRPQIQMFQTFKILGISDLDVVSDFDIRISDFRNIWQRKQRQKRRFQAAAGVSK